MCLFRSATRYAPHFLCVARPSSFAVVDMPRRGDRRRLGTAFNAVQSGRLLVDLDLLRRAVAGPRIANPAAMLPALRNAHNPLGLLLELVLSVRQRPQTRAAHNVNVALALLRRRQPRRWVTLAVRRCFAIYCALRRAAVPQASRGAAGLKKICFLRGVGPKSVPWKKVYSHGIVNFTRTEL